MDTTKELQGCRISASHLEQIIPIYKEYKETNEITFSDITNPDTEEIETNAKLSFVGTQLHNLVYFTKLYNKSELLDRKPNYQDIKVTFPTTQIDICNAYQTLYEQTENPIELWRKWIMNCELPKQKNLSTILDPEIIMGIWQSGIYNKDIENVLINLPKPDFEHIEMNEVLTILNLQFNRNLQFPSSVDSLIIPKDFPNEPIQIIDYKTGKEVSNISFTSKLQAMLMSISIYYNFIDRIPKIPWGLSQWDITHPNKLIDLPTLKRRALMSPQRFNTSVDIDTVYEDMTIIAKNVKFVYMNPITRETHDINFLPISEHALDYIYELNDFYSNNKRLLKKSPIYNYLTPEFIPEKITNYPTHLKNSKEHGTQIAMF